MNDQIKEILSENALNQLFNSARTYNRWQNKPVSEDLIKKLYDLVKMGPTSVNCGPARFVFVTSQDGKEKLNGCLSEGNQAKAMQAPVNVIIAFDLEFPTTLAKLFPHVPAVASWFDDSKNREDTALRNSSLQGAYLIMAARALGLDCGPMSGFDAGAVDKAFFDGSSYKTNFICCLGYGDDEGMHNRLPRLTFEEAAEIK